jgi:hypothetical protein
MATTIFHKLNQRQRRENAFADFLASRLGGAVLNQRYTVDPKLFEHPVNKNRLLRCLTASDCYLRKRQACIDRRRQECIDWLRKLPAQIRVALNDPSRISFDIVVERDSHPYYWEFHEKQHRELTVTMTGQHSRGSLVYGPNGEEFHVPRFLQRLIRDVWRITYFPDYTIIWYDWFDAERDRYSPLVSSGFREYYHPHEFSFTAFCKPYQK